MRRPGLLRPHCPDLPSAPGALRGLGTRVSTAMDQVDWPGLARTVDLALNRAAIEVKRRRAALRPTVVVAYRGWYADGVAHVTARAMEKPLFGATNQDLGPGAALKATLRRFTVLTMSDVTVRASSAGAAAQFTSDVDGYLHMDLAVGPLSPGWHVVEIEPLDAAVRGTVARVLVADPRGGLAVISDIDDTIMKTGVTQRWTAAGRTLFRDVTDRRPVPGMATFYAGLARGDDAGRPVPFFYVSTGSWNLYDYLIAFTGLHGFPRGPLFLTDWGPTSHRFLRDGGAHKRETISALVEGHPRHSFVLIGDVGQGDPEAYEHAARQHTGRVCAIFLLSVGTHLAQRSQDVAAHAAQVRQQGIPMYYVDSAAGAVTVARQLGLVDEATAELVDREPRAT